MNTPEDWAKLLKKARAGDAEAQYDVAMEYETGLIINKVVIAPRNRSSAFKWCKAAAEQGYAPGLLRMADYLSEGKYCAPDRKKAISIYKKLIANGDSAAAHNLGIVYRDMRLTGKAFELFQLANTMSKEKGSVQLALCHYHGIGTTKDIQKARKMLLQVSNGTITASGFDENEANYLLGVMYLNGDGVKQSITKARKYLLLADEDEDHRPAQQLLWVIGRR